MNPYEALKLIILLILPTIAYATDESSYLYGKGQGKGAFGDCLNFNSDCYTAEEVCQNLTTTYVRNETTGLLDSIYHNDIMNCGIVPRWY